jgi:hypothetical protein
VKARRCRDLCKQVQDGTLSRVTTSTIVAEVTYVLYSAATYRSPGKPLHSDQGHS